MLKDTCQCGAELLIEFDQKYSFERIKAYEGHAHWLSAHRVCREANPSADKYSQLLLAVSKKFQGETRFDTALRYIKEAEARGCDERAKACS